VSGTSHYLDEYSSVTDGMRFDVDAIASDHDAFGVWMPMNYCTAVCYGSRNI
jgi:hypothetical protein